jgi:hypothetical protein
MEILKYYMYELVERNISGTSDWEVVNSDGNPSPIPKPAIISSSSGEGDFVLTLLPSIGFSQSDYDPDFYPHQQEAFSMPDDETSICHDPAPPKIVCQKCRRQVGLIEVMGTIRSYCMHCSQHDYQSYPIIKAHLSNELKHIFVS